MWQIIGLMQSNHITTPTCSFGMIVLIGLGIIIFLAMWMYGCAGLLGAFEDKKVKK